MSNVKANTEKPKRDKYTWLHKNKKKMECAIKVDISEVQTRKALDQLISRRMLRSVITSKESFWIMNSNGSFVNTDKCTGECYVQLSNICEQIKALDVKMGQCCLFLMWLMS